ncbi:peptidase M48 Ste24p [Nitrosococcus halophilus Nc 4]|uniref:Peptidase M48 Ste24p n=1 Tax=Nitrosococcus halophilus (strain Nc4) TaxID=472759 RepID=D5C0C7_NITHN|nr:M48 family metallopeptidase [Nitrosococcus halophilus]ADE14453.1 peptidase M48 Ste24p [Nitrosococcus halophilus Nc 4]
MRNNLNKSLLLSLLSLLLLAACATSPTGRTQLEFFPSNQMAQMGEAAYRQIKQETPASQDPAINRYVHCVAEAVTAVAPPPQSGDQWEVAVFKADQVNAFALPGGYIGIYTGLLSVAENADQLAAVIGHEIGHVIAQHGNARLSTQYATQAGLQLVQILTGTPSSATGQQLMALLGVGAQVGIVLPFSRAQESESDILGLRYMARACFDPRQSIQLWENMMQTGGPQPLEFLSTHPSDQSRIRHLEQSLPKALELYQQALDQGRRPKCKLEKKQ